MRLSHITAMSKNRVIGVDNGLPWNLPEDMKFFREKTKGRVLIMGRKTFESLPSPLPNRKHIVITRNSDYHPSHPDVFVVPSFAKAVEKARTLVPSSDDEVFVIGGGEIYAQSMNVVDRIYLTVIDREFSGDTYYPEVDPKVYELVEKRDRTEPLPFSFLTYEKRSSHEN